MGGKEWEKLFNYIITSNSKRSNKNDLNYLGDLSENTCLVTDTANVLYYKSYHIA